MTSLSEKERLQKNLEEISEIKEKLEKDAETIQGLLHNPSSRFSVQLYTVYLEEQQRQLQKVQQIEAYLRVQVDNKAD
jgi:hypothetical protein